MSVHSFIGASSCERFWNCPGSIILSKQAPPQRPSIYAAEGTVAHTLAEKYLRSHSRMDYRQVGNIVRQEGFGIEVTNDMVEAVSVYIDFLLDTLETNQLSRRRLQVEVGFSLSHIDPEAFGTCDAAIGRFDWPLIVDYKHGAGQAVQVANNKQTLYYGLGYYYNLPKKERKYVEGLDTAIVQPRCPHPDGQVRQMRYTVDDLLEFESGLVDAIARVRRGDSTLRAGSWCKFCPAKPICSEARNSALKTAYTDFIDLDDEMFDDPTDVPGTSNLLDVAGLSTQQLSVILEKIPFLRDWCDSIESHAFHLAEAGREIPNYMLASRRSNRQWKKGVEDEIEVMFGDKVYAPPKLATPNQLEKALPKNQRYALARYWEKPDKGKTLVRVETGREKRLPSAITDFIDLDID